MQTIKVTKRSEMRKDVQALREVGMVPGVIYGPELEENILVTVPSSELERLYENVGETGLISVEVEGESEPYEALIKSVAYEPVLMRIDHVDFYKFKRGQKIEAAISLNFVGEAPAVKTMGGVLVPALQELNVKSLPRDLISELDVDISTLDTFDGVISVKDLNIPEGFEVLDDPEAPVATVMAPRVEEEPEGAPEAEMPESEEGAEKPGDDAAPDPDKPESKK